MPAFRIGMFVWTFSTILSITVRGQDTRLSFDFTNPLAKASRAMRKTTRRRPEVETLEAMTLLSGIAPAAQPVTAFRPLQLSGALQGTTATHGTGSPTFKVWGALSPLGKVTAAGHGSIATVTGPNGSFSLLSPLGRLFVATHVASTSKHSFAGDYTIQGGTQSYAGDTGSGPFTVASHPDGKFFATFG